MRLMKVSLFRWKQTDPLVFARLLHLPALPVCFTCLLYLSALLIFLALPAFRLLPIRCLSVFRFLYNHSSLPEASFGRFYGGLGFRTEV